MLEQFETWLSARAVREYGAAPAPSTLESKVMRVRGAMTRMGLETPEQLAALLNDRHEVERLLDRYYASCKPVTIQTALVALRHFGEFAVAQGLAERCAISPNDAPKSVPRKAITVYSEAEMERLLIYARARGNIRQWAFIATLKETGRRVGELLRLRWEHVHLEAEPPYFDLPWTKNKRQALVPMSRFLREEVWTDENMDQMRHKLRRTAQRSPEVHPFPWTYKTAQRAYERLCEVSGVPYRGFHCFRHTKATELLGKGVPLQAVAALLGHSSTQTTDRIYNHATALDYARYVD